MIPIQLSLEGIYSYQKRQIIDFAALTDAGLFGIFGAVHHIRGYLICAIRRVGSNEQCEQGLQHDELEVGQNVH
jgi:hypothetical protein